MKFLILSTLLMLSTSAHAYYATMDTGKIIPTGKYRAIIGPQFITTGENDGTNVSARFDAGVGESTTMRGLVGFGQDELFYAGLFGKYVPFPDTDSQPALGLTGGVTFGHEEVYGEKEEVLTLRVAPLISKDFETDIGVVTPYGALPISAAFVDGRTIYPVQFTGGAEFKPYNWENVSFMGEVGLKMNKAFSYVELAVVIEFEDH